MNSAGADTVAVASCPICGGGMAKGNNPSDDGVYCLQVHGLCGHAFVDISKPTIVFTKTCVRDGHLLIQNVPSGMKVFPTFHAGKSGVVTRRQYISRAKMEVLEI